MPAYSLQYSSYLIIISIDHSRLLAKLLHMKSKQLKRTAAPTGAGIAAGGNPHTAGARDFHGAAVVPGAVSQNQISLLKCRLDESKQRCATLSLFYD